MRSRTVSRQSILRRWTSLYVCTLGAGLLVIGIVSVFWIGKTTIDRERHLMQLLAQQLADHLVDERGRIAINQGLPAWVDKTQRSLDVPEPISLAVSDAKGQLLFLKMGPRIGSETRRDAPPPPPPQKGTFTNASASEPDDFLLNETSGVYTVSVPILHDGASLGTVTIRKPKQQPLEAINQEYRLLAALLGASGLLGWLIIYLLARKLTRPIVEVAEAARSIEQGRYTVHLREDVKERELYELLGSFSTMAARLTQLEQLRTELLAGVTHDLKTPIASIQGLLHAVRDGIVQGDEAADFLDIAQKEASRLQQMVSDLLDFHSFASGKLRVNRESVELGKLLNEITYQWGLTEQADKLSVSLNLPDQPIQTIGDPGRIQQIIVNLLNNSRQAIAGEGMITVSLLDDSPEWAAILIADTGCGIPLEEQPNIFERYFRGKQKQLHVRGLGLGLTFSSMIASAMGAELALQESSPRGTTFRLLLPKGEPQSPPD